MWKSPVKDPLLSWQPRAACLAQAVRLSVLLALVPQKQLGMLQLQTSSLTQAGAPPTIMQRMVLGWPDATLSHLQQLVAAQRSEGVACTDPQAQEKHRR